MTKAPALGKRLAASDDRVVCNGIDGVTGGYFTAPTTVAAVARAARERLAIPGVPAAPTSRADFDPMRLAVMARLDKVGWGVVFSRDTPPAVRAALEPLLARRRQEAGPLFRTLEFDRETDTFRGWLGRHGVSPGNTDWKSVPFYLLLVGPPTSIPFELQYLLDIEYAVGRLAFDAPSEYAAYADSVRRYETATEQVAAREIVYWGPRHEGDTATELSADELLAPLIRPPDGTRSVAASCRFDSTRFLADQGTASNLRGTLHRPDSRLPPAMLFTASHGLGWPADDPRQATAQGALLGQEWELFDAIAPEHCVAASDVRDDARVHGLIACTFACFGAGTPAEDSFRFDRASAPARLAPAPFVSALPRRLLAHPRGGALAVVGHVDRAWSFSIRPTDAPARTRSFRLALHCILKGLPVGLSTTHFSLRYAALSAGLLDSIEGAAITDEALAWDWIERNDAQSYVVLGDPAARLRPEVLA